MATPTSDTPLVLLRNDGGGTALVGSLNGNTWSRQTMGSNNPLQKIDPGDVNNDKDLEQVIVGAGYATSLRGEQVSTIEQTNILFTIDCPDINGDRTVNVDDLLLVIAYWNTTNPLADLNFDGVVSVDDLLIIISNWGPCE